VTTDLTATSPTVSCDQITEVLRDYHKGTEDSKDFQARLARVEVDQESALSSQTLGDEEIAEEITRLISLKAVLTTRAERKQTDQARLISQLEKLYPLAAGEFSSLLNAELDKRRAIVTDRILQAVELDENLTMHETLAVPQYTGPLAECDKSVRSIARLRPTMHWGNPGDGPGIAASASALLSNLEKFNSMTS
jgi:hypothetical protein